jgi:hypothetical protein
MTQGLPPTAAEIPMMILAALESQADAFSASGALLSSVIPLLDEAEKLNNERLDSPRWLRRVLRRQARINRLVREAAQSLLTFLSGMKGVHGRALLQPSFAAIEEAERLSRRRSGPGFIRRLTRPQSEINECVMSAICVMAEWVTDGEKGFANPETAKLILWHVREAEYLSGRRKKRLRYIRRVKADQYQINRCGIIALRSIVGLFVPGGRK